MKINMNSIMKKVEDWSKTAEGKRRMQKVIDDSLDAGSLTTPSGAEIIPMRRIEEMVSNLLDALYLVAQSYDVPPSVLEHIAQLQKLKPKVIQRKAVVDVYFGGNLHRDSLMPERYGGVNNIVALLNNGYPENENIGKVWGTWHSMRIHGLTERTGLHFIQEAVDGFNREYGTQYNVTAVAGDDYNDIG